MSEAREVAKAMIDALTAQELNKIRACQGITPLEYVKKQMGDESHSVIMAVYDEFSRMVTLP